MKKASLRAVLGASVVAAAVLTGTAGATPAGKILICHGTASDSNPYVLISVSANAAQGHLEGYGHGHGKNNHPDVLASNGNCDFASGGGGSGEE